MTTYEIILLYIRKNHRLINLRRACNSGEIPVSYPQAIRCVRRAEDRGALTVTRNAEEQGRPLVLEEAVL
jgi:hypothetical protein